MSNTRLYPETGINSRSDNDVWLYYRDGKRISRQEWKKEVRNYNGNIKRTEYRTYIDASKFEKRTYEV